MGLLFPIGYMIVVEIFRFQRGVFIRRTKTEVRLTSVRVVSYRIIVLLKELGKNFNTYVWL